MGLFSKKKTETETADETDEIGELIAEESVEALLDE